MNELMHDLILFSRKNNINETTSCRGGANEGEELRKRRGRRRSQGRDFYLRSLFCFFFLGSEEAGPRPVVVGSPWRSFL